MLPIQHELDGIGIESIHPSTIYNKERELAQDFVEEHPCSGGLDPCPLSGVSRHDILFSKWGQQYAFCPETWNLSLTSMPDAATVHAYFYTSKLAEYRASEDYQRIANRLRTPLWRSQLNWIESRIYLHMQKDRVRLADWGTKFAGWHAILSQSPAIADLTVCEPLPPVIADDDGSTFDVICLQDAFQRTITPKVLMQQIYERLQPGGLLILACRSGTGFDILSLREHSDSIFPYDHICLPSPGGMESLLTSMGFEVLETTTPGLLDMQLIRKGELPRDQLFQRYLKDTVPESDDAQIQTFLAHMRLSSHLRVVARKISRM